MFVRNLYPSIHYAQKVILIIRLWIVNYKLNIFSHAIIIGSLQTIIYASNFLKSINCNLEFFNILIILNYCNIAIILF